MTQANLLEQARQGDPNAIAALMNRTLQAKGITANVERTGDRLLVRLEAEQLPNRQAMTTFVQNGILGLKTQVIQSIEIQGQQKGSDRSAWIQEIYLGAPVASAPDSPPTRSGGDLASSDLQSPLLNPPPPPPPLRPAPPPIEQLRPASPVPDPEIETETAEAVVVPLEPVSAPEPRVNLHASIPPGEEIVTAPRPAPRRSGLLLPLLVLALLSGLIGAIVGYALWRDRTAPAPLPISPRPTVVTPSPNPAIPSPTNQTRSANPLQDASTTATRAATLARSAQSADDWSLVASQWQQAIALLEAVPVSSPDYARAQAQLRQAQTQLATAQQQATRPIASAPPPNTTFTVTREITCPTDAAGSSSAQPIELSNVAFQQGNTIIGCITNNTNQPIAAVSIGYQGNAPAPTDSPPAPPDASASPSSPAATPQTSNSALNFGELAAQRTVPFSSSIELGAEATNITISTINWTPAGASQPQQLPTSIGLSR